MEAGALRYFEGMKMLLKYAVLILLLGVLIHLSCKKEYSCEGCADKKTSNNNFRTRPVITFPTDSVAPEGTASGDPDGKMSSYLWAKIASPASFSIMKCHVLQFHLITTFETSFKSCRA